MAEIPKDILAALKVVEHKANGGVLAWCPLHRDGQNPNKRRHTPNLNIDPGEKADWVYFCHVCEDGGGMDKLRQRLCEEGLLSWPEILAVYDYRDEAGKLSYQIIRSADKRFRQRVRQGKDGWREGSGCMQSVMRLPYRLPELMKADKGEWIVIVEGEKDCDTLAKYDVGATTNSGGAGKWLSILSSYFTGRKVAILPDNDDKGRRHAQDVAVKISDYAKEVRIVELPGLPEGGDVTDWFEAGHTKAELTTLVENTSPWIAPTKTVASPSDEPMHRTDLGNARRLVRAHGQDLRYCHPWGKWLTWNGTHWAEDDTAEVHRRAKDVPRMILAAASVTDDDAQRESLAKWAIACESAGKQSALLQLARSEPGVPILPVALDSDLCLFNVLNGTLNLCTGKLQPHRRSDYITKIAPVTFDSKATCPGFLKALGEIFAGNEAIIGYVQRSLGRALTGDVSEQQIDIWYGGGDNGKSMLHDLNLRLWGDYGLMAPPGLLLATHGERHPAELATLKGVRLAVSMEVGEGNRLNEERVKQLTGTDRISARRMREDFWTFTPTHHLFLGTNHKPTIRGSDLAIWKRIRLVPFTVRIPPEQQDKHLAERLWQEEASGILNWLIAGCLAWMKDGLQPPEEVMKATAEYRSDMDVLGDFLTEECVEDAVAISAFGPLYAAYNEWAKRSGERRPLTAAAFGLKLNERGFEKATTTDGKRARLGLELKSVKRLSEQNNAEAAEGSELV